MEIKDLLSFYQHRMDLAASEQLWIIAVLGALCAFVFKYGEHLRLIAEPKWLRRLAASITALGNLYIWSRQGIYLHYSGLIDEALKKAGQPNLTTLSGWDRLARTGVQWSGVVLFSVIALGLGVAISWRLGRAGTKTEEKGGGEGA